MSDEQHPILDLPMHDGKTIRQWFTDALHALILNGEGFSGKRPLGNSGWWTDLRGALEAGGIVDANAPDQTVDTILLGAISEAMHPAGYDGKDGGC